MVGVGAHEHAAALVVGDDLVEKAVGRPTQRAGAGRPARLERVILEVERHHLGVGRDRVDALFAPGAEQLQRRAVVHLRIVELRRRRGIHHIAVVDLHRIGIARRDLAVPADVLVELHMHEPVFLERMHAPRLGLARLEEAQRLGDRHLEHQYLILGERQLRDAMARLHDGRVRGRGRDLHAGGLDEELADRHRVGGVVRALVDHLEDVVRPEDRGGDLHAAGAPALRHRHLAARERHLVAGDRDRLEDGAADHPLGLLVEIGEVVGGRAHSAASATSPCGAGASASGALSATKSARRRRTRPSSAWKST